MPIAAESGNSPVPSSNQPQVEGSLSLSDLPGESGTTEVVEEILRVFSHRSGPAQTGVDQAISREMKSEHIGQLLEISKLREENRHKEVTERFRNQPAILVLSIATLLLFILAFSWLALSYAKWELILPVVTGVTGFVAGCAGGYGLGRHKSSQSPSE